MGTLATAAKNAAMDASFNLVDAGASAGYIELQIVGNIEVATLTFSDPAFVNSVAGSKAANSITSDSSATGNATAVSICQLFDSNGALVYTGTVGLSNSDINLTSVNIVAGDIVTITSMSIS